MTHGDQAKAKTAKSGQASATKKTSSKTGGKTVQAGKGGKGGKASVKEVRQSSKAGKIVVKKQEAGSEKSRPSLRKSPLAAKESGNGGKTKGRPVPAAAAPDDTATSFTNSAVAAAFKRALKKYPNAFRKLTD